MAERPPERPDRLNRTVDDLLRDRRLRVGPEDTPERREIMLAAQLAAAGRAHPHMRAAFRRRLAAGLAGRQARTFPTRRAAIVAGLGLAVGAAAGLGLGRQEHPMVASRSGSPSPLASRPPQSQPAVIDPRPGHWLDVAALEDLLEGQPQRFNVGAFSAYLVRQGDRVNGLSSVCSHLPCELLWNQKQSELVCPCHNQSFDPQGQPVRDNYPVPPLARVRVQVVNGRVQVLGV